MNPNIHQTITVDNADVGMFNSGVQNSNRNRQYRLIKLYVLYFHDTIMQNVFAQDHTSIFIRIAGN